MGSGYAFGQGFMSILKMLLCYFILRLISLSSEKFPSVRNYNCFPMVSVLVMVWSLYLNSGAMALTWSVLNYFYLGYSYTNTAISFPISCVV